MMRRRRFSLLPAALLSTPAFASLDDSLQRLQQQWRPRLAWRADLSWRAEAGTAPGAYILQPGDDGAGFDTEVLAEETRTGGVSPNHFDCASRRASMRRPSSCAPPARTAPGRAAAARPWRAL